MSLDLSKLEKVVAGSDGWKAACPVCRKDGRDSTGNHLHVWRSGKYSCAVLPGDDAHNKAIYALAGLNGSGEYDGSEYVEPEEKVELPQIWPKETLAGLIRDDTYWNNRGISSETLAPFQGGVATRYQMKGRFVFPMFNDKDEIIGFTGRALDNGVKPKWRHIGKKSQWVWGGLDEIESSRRAILVESPGDLLRCSEAGVKDVLCMFGVSLSETLIAKLVALNPLRIIISTNRDVEHAVGQVAATRAKSMLDRLFNPDSVEIMHPPVGRKDWGECDISEIAAAFNPPSSEPQQNEPPQ